MHTPSFQPRGRRGFTLVELLIVIVLMGIASAIAVPRMQGVVRVGALRGSLNQVAGDVTLARVTAIRSGRRVQVRINAAGTGYLVIRDPAGTAPDTAKRVSLSDYAGLTLSPASGILEFDSRGMIAANVSGGKVKATREGRSDSLFISGVGRVYRAY